MITSTEQLERTFRDYTSAHDAFPKALAASLLKRFGKVRVKLRPKNSGLSVEAILPEGFEY